MMNAFDLLILLCLFLPVVLMASVWLGGDRQPLPAAFPEALAREPIAVQDAPAQDHPPVQPEEAPEPYREAA